MKKHGVLLDMVNNSITFFTKYCTHFGAFLFLISQHLEETEMMFKVKQEDIIPKRILKKRIDEKLDEFLNTIIKILRKKKCLLYGFK